jgi:hypothetical protein
VFRSRIINGGMVIDQRNAGASVTVNSSTVVFPVDRFTVYQISDGVLSAQQDTSAPTGFVNSLKITTTTTDASLSAAQYASVYQPIEGFNTSDLGWGTANAKTVTVSFWVRSSLTGTFGASLLNSALDRSYPFTYSISVADTWEQKTITVAGDTSGTWLTTNGVGIYCLFSLGSGTDREGTANAWNTGDKRTVSGAVSVIGTLSATWYVTGVQLEVGTQATSFEYRQYGTEFQLCQRYFQTTSMITGAGHSTTVVAVATPFQTTMRASPTLGQQGVIQISSGTADFTQSAVSVSNLGSTNNSMVLFINNFSGLTAGAPYLGYRNSANTNALTLSAEL